MYSKRLPVRAAKGDGGMELICLKINSDISVNMYQPPLTVPASRFLGKRVNRPRVNSPVPRTAVRKISDPGVVLVSVSVLDTIPVAVSMQACVRCIQDIGVRHRPCRAATMAAARVLKER